MNSGIYAKSATTGPQAVTAFLDFIISLVSYHYFSLYTSDINYYENTDCVNLLYYSQIYTKFLYFLIYFRGIYCFCVLSSCDMFGLLYLVNSLSYVIGLVFFSLIGWALLNGEPCGSLNTFAKIWVLLSTVAGSCFCCLCCLGLGYSLDKLSDSSNNRYHHY